MNIKHTLNIAYEGLMLTLVIISVTGIFIQGDSSVWQYIHTAVWVIFLIDVTVRFIKALSKWKHLKQNPFDIISVIPLEDFLLFARFARFIKLFRYKKIIQRYLTRLDRLADQISLRVVTAAIIAVLGLISAIISITTATGVLSALIWTGRNFVQFNYQSDLSAQYPTLLVVAVILKVAGLLYAGLIVKRLINIAEQIWHHIKTPQD